MGARRPGMLALGFGLGAVFAACDSEPPPPLTCEDRQELQIFRRRIAPLLVDGSRSACNECHLQGVDLGLYSPDGDECRTMACMADAGIVDLEAPEDSVVLEWIMRSDPESALITTDVLQQERDGMLEWIEYYAECGGKQCSKIEDPCGKAEAIGRCDRPSAAHDLPSRGFEDPGDCSDATIERAFGELIYSWRGRCYPCHFDSRPGDPLNAPRWIVDGECSASSLATMRNVIEFQLIDRDAPDQSSLLLKPLAEQYGGVDHEGSAKFESPEDGAYNDFLTWINLYVSCTTP